MTTTVRTLPQAGLALSDLLLDTIESVVRAQEKLDDYTLIRKAEYEQAPEGSLAIPPLWYTFHNVQVEMELSAVVGEIVQSQAPKDETTPSSTQTSQLVCRTLNPAMVAMYGYQASAGLKVRLQLGPRGPLPIKVDDDLLRE